MGNTSKNYLKDGGDTTVIGGKLEVLEGATVTGLTETAAAASSAALGGIKADTKGAGDTVECKIDGTSSKLYVPTYPVLPVAATAETAGLVMQAANVSKAAGTNPTATEFNALLDALIAAGVMAEAPQEG
jgi:hypothetical protein